MRKQGLHPDMTGFIPWFLRVPGFACSVAVTCLLLPKCVGQSAQVYKERVNPNWFSDSERFWYRNELAGGKPEFVLVDVAKKTRSPALDHVRMAETLSIALGEEVTAERLPIRSLEFSDDLRKVTATGRRGSWKVDLGSYEIIEEAGGEGHDKSNVELFLPARSSKNRGGRVAFRVTNKRNDVVEVFWVNHSGQRVSYGKVKATKTLSLSSYRGHTWVLQDANGKDIAGFEANPDPTVVVIDDETKPERRPALKRSEGGRRPSRSSMARSRAFVRDHNLWLKPVSNDEESDPVQLTTYGTPKNSFRRDAQRARLLQMQYGKQDYPDDEADISWSPDGRHFVAFQTTQVSERKVTYVESSPKNDLQPKVQTYPYAKPGDEIPTRSVHLFDSVENREIPVSGGLFPNLFSLKLLRWSEDGKRCWLEYNERGHQVLRVLELAVEDGSTRAVVEERSDTFVHYSDGGKHVLEWLPEEQLLWASERSGWNHLYRYDLKKSEVINALTRGEWNVKRIERVDREQQQVWFYAVGIVPGQDPYHEHFCRVNFDGSNLVVLTEGDGTHDVTFSPDRRFLLDRYSRVDQPPVTELRNAKDGSLVVKLEEADASEILDSRGSFPERFEAPGRDGKTPIYGIIHRPRDFDPKKKYPVVENIYAGPHDHHVPKGFRSRYRHQQQIADRGFVVVQIDGMGTAWRSKDFHDVCYKNLRDSGFPDRIAWMKAAAEKYPWMDISRVGIYGGSAGGQNAMAALLWHGDFYKAAVADCGCHDNRMDKIWWNEQWMGVPGDGSYVKNSNMENADRLQGHLMLVVGEMDRNVDPATTTQVVKKLIDADKDFDFLLIPGAGHGACETPYGSRRRADFFEKWLQ